MTLDIFRELNQVLPLVAFGWLTFRIATAWPAHWAKPDHVWHYRALLILLASYVLLSSLGAWWYETHGSPVGPVSPAYTGQTLLVIAFCYRWPQKMRPAL